MKRPIPFEKIHESELLGKLTLPDRVMFRGHLKFRDPRTLRVFLAYNRVLLKDFGAYAQAMTTGLKEYAERLAAEASRPFLYLSSPHTARTGYSKEQLARDIAKRDGVREGLICGLSVLEPGAFRSAPGRSSGKKALILLGSRGVQIPSGTLKGATRRPRRYVAPNVLPKLPERSPPSS